MAVFTSPQHFFSGPAYPAMNTYAVIAGRRDYIFNLAATFIDLVDTKV